MLLWRGRGAWRALALVVLVLPWTLGQSLRERAVDRAAGPARTVAIVQGAIPQDIKWLKSAANRQHILDIYAQAASRALGAEFIMWPEAALPDYCQRLHRVPGYRVVGLARRRTRQS